MRITVLILSVLGAGACGFFGYRWKTNLDEVAEGTRKDMALLKKMGVRPPAELQKNYDLVVERTRTYPFMLANLAMGVFAGMLALRGRGLCAAALLLTATIGPAVLAPPTLILTGVMGLGGLLALFIRRKPQPAPAPVPAPAFVEE